MMTLLSEWCVYVSWRERKRERKDSVCSLLLHHAIMVSGHGGIPSAFYLDQYPFQAAALECDHVSQVLPPQCLLRASPHAQVASLVLTTPCFFKKVQYSPLNISRSVQSPVLTLHTRREDMTLACRSPGLRSPPRCLCHSSPPQTLEQLCEPEILASIRL